MSNPERLKELLREAKEEVNRMDYWMKDQEPAPGVDYQDWIKKNSPGDGEEEK